ncbi:hypothetical protein [Microbulbifer sp. ZKSA002]|uniref:hypothetical protein n=1 Tax=Microbulbifer sp. ZKSA002 TaxID=3243388 RepID=UPI004039C0D1
MQVTIPDRKAQEKNWGTTASQIPLKTMEISDNCPKCGGPRGIPYRHNFYEDGETYSVSKWDNPCGHIDKYRDVINQEAA